MAYNYKNLVFKGGGVLGIAYAGALQVLEQNNILQQIERVAGTSAGAITAALVSMRYSAGDIKTIVNQTNFKSFEDKLDPLRVATKYGLFEGDAFLQWIQARITAKGLAATATFADFQKAGMMDLHVFSSDLNSQAVKEFSFATSPNVVVAEAVRASMSIPLFFRGWQFSNNNPDNHIYVDGGMVYNYPITTFDTGNVANMETLGMFLTNLGPAPAPSSLGYGHLLEYVRATFDLIMDAQNVNFFRDPDELKRTVKIDNLGISPTDFGLSTQQQTDLFNSGVKYVTEFLQQQGSAA